MEKNEGNQINISGKNQIGRIQQHIAKSPVPDNAQKVTSINQRDLREIIGQNRIDEALQMLLTGSTDRTVSDIATSLNRRWTDIKTEKLKGVLSNDDYTVEVNKITDALLQVINFLPDD